MIKIISFLLVSYMYYVLIGGLVLFSAWFAQRGFDENRSAITDILVILHLWPVIVLWFLTESLKAGFPSKEIFSKSYGHWIDTAKKWYEDTLDALISHRVGR